MHYKEAKQTPIKQNLVILLIQTIDRLRGSITKRRVSELETCGMTVR